MAVTRLKRKALRNKLKAKKRQATLKHLLFMPTIKNLDLKKDQSSSTIVDSE